MSVCKLCGKHTSVGRRSRHRRGVAGKRWRNRAQVISRTFKPNIQKKTFVIAGQKQQINVCTSCLKKVKKDGAVGSYSNISVS